MRKRDERTHEWSVVSGQWSVVSGQWSVVSGQLSGECSEAGAIDEPAAPSEPIGARENVTNEPTSCQLSVVCCQLSGASMKRATRRTPRTNPPRIGKTLPTNPPRWGRTRRTNPISPACAALQGKARAAGGRGIGAPLVPTVGRVIWDGRFPGPRTGRTPARVTDISIVVFVVCALKTAARFRPQASRAAHWFRPWHLAQEWHKRPPNTATLCHFMSQSSIPCGACVLPTRLTTTRPRIYFHLAVAYRIMHTMSFAGLMSRSRRTTPHKRTLGNLIRAARLDALG
jgi:hypothetical protein